MKYIVAHGAAAIEDLKSAGFPAIPYFEGAEIEGAYSVGKAADTQKRALFEATKRLEDFFIAQGAFE